MIPSCHDRGQLPERIEDLARTDRSPAEPEVVVLLISPGERAVNTGIRNPTLPPPRMEVHEGSRGGVVPGRVHGHPCVCVCVCLDACVVLLLRVAQGHKQPSLSAGPFFRPPKAPEIPSKVRSRTPVRADHITVFSLTLSDVRPDWVFPPTKLTRSLTHVGRSQINKLTWK